MSHEYFFEDQHGQFWRTTTDGDDRKRGRCSGIPECCIDYFIDLHIPGRLRVSDDNDGRHYAACPACIAADVCVELKYCHDNDGADCTCGAWANRQPVEEPKLEEVEQALVDILEFDEQHGVESDAHAIFDPKGFGTEGETYKATPYVICIDHVTGDSDDDVWITSREARCLAASLLRAADEADMEAEDHP